MAAPTDEAMLEEVSNAIYAIVSGRVTSYSINGRKIDALDLAQLREMKRDLELKISRKAAKGFFRPGGFACG